MMVLIKDAHLACDNRSMLATSFKTGKTGRKDNKGGFSLLQTGLDVFVVATT